MENFSNENTDQETAEILRLTPDVSPEESVKTIERATRLEIHPDSYDKKAFDSEAEIQERVPATVSEPVKNYMKKSSNHANAVKNEVGVLEKIGNQAKHIYYNLFEKQDLESEIMEMNKLDSESENGLAEDQYEYLDQLYDAQREEIEEFGLTDNEQIPGQVAGVVNDMVRAVGNNKLLIAASTGLGAVSPVPGGTVVGLGYGVTGALALDAYRRVRYQTFGELRRMKDDDGKLLNLDRNTRDNISNAVGLVSGALEAVTGKVLTGGLQKLTGKRAVNEVVKNVALRARMDALGSVAKTAIASGGEEVSAEIVAIIGENFAKGANDEAGLLNAIDATYEDIKNDPAVRKRLALTATVGTLAGGVISAGPTALGVGKAKKQIEANNVEIERNNTINQAVKTLNAQQDFMAVAKTSIETEFKTNSPEEMTAMRKQMFQEAGFTNKVFFNETDILKIEETDPELAARIRELDVTESNGSDVKAPIGIEPHHFLDLIEEAPSVSEFARMNPEAPNPAESKNLLTALNKAAEARQDILSSLEVDQELTPEQIKTIEELDAGVEETFRNRGVDAYVDESKTFTEAIEGVISDKEVEKFNKSQTEARENVALQLIDEFNEREQRTENRVVRANEKIQKELQLKKHKKELETVEKFKGDRKTKGSESHKVKGHSPLAIDPATLPAELREAYLTDPKLKKRKVFVEGGISADDSAAMAGFDSSEEMLKSIANAPTQAELLAARKAKAAEIRKQVKESRGNTKNERLDQVFDELSKLHREEMKFMKDKNWSSTKQGVKKIALPLPNIKSLNVQAKSIVARTKVDNISPRQYNAGEKSLQRKAVNHILNNEVEQAFLTKEKAILNSELTRESLKARKAVDSARDFIKKFSSKKTQANLKSAGLDGAANEILNLFNLNKTSGKQAANQQSYLDYISRLAEQGESVIVPDSLSDIRQRGEDLTVEQYIRVTDRLRTLDHQAKLKNKLLKSNEKRAKAKKLATIESISVDAVENLTEHPTFNTETFNNTTNRNSKNFRLRLKETFQFTSSLLTNFKNVVTELDQEALNGKHYSNLAQPMIDAELTKRSKTLHVVNQIKAISNDYGNQDFADAFNDFKHIVEFEGYAELGNGKMAKSDLWRLFSYLGDPTAIQRFKNFKNAKGEPMTVETVRRVLETHLDEKDAKLAQNFTNIFESFKQESFDLHKRTTGVEPTMVQGIPIEFKGKVYDGGYVPLDYLNTSPQEKVSRYIDALGEKETSMFGDNTDSLYSRLRSAEMTDQGRLIDRSGTSLPLDTDFRTLLNAYEEHSHDIAFREAGIDTLKLLRNDAYSAAIIATVGQSKYELLGKAVIETVGKAHDEDVLHPFSKERNAANNIVKYIESGFSVGILGFKASSVLMQGLSLGPAALRMGPTGARYIAKSIGNILMNPNKFNEIFDEAVRLNPDLQFNKDSIDDTLVASTFDFIPKSKNEGKNSKGLAKVSKYKQNFVDVSMMGLKKLDVYIKAAVTMAANAQFENGDVAGFSKAKLEAMGETKRNEASKKYIKQVADLALTTSATIDKNAFEKVPLLRLFGKFYTDVRSQFNTTASQVRKIRNEGIKAGENFSDGNINQGTGNIKTALSSGSSLLAVYVLSKLYTDTIRDEETPLSELGNMRSLGEWIENTAEYAVKAPVEGVIGSIPVARDLQYALGSRSRKKRVSVPLMSAFSEFTMGITGLANWLDGQEMTRQQQKGFLVSLSTVSGGLPIKNLVDVAGNIEDSETWGSIVQFTKNEMARAGKGIAKYIKANEGDESKAEIIEDLKQIQKDVLPPEAQNVDDILPEDILETMKRNKWDDLNNETGAAGVYQFTEQRWDEIAEEQPSLGLTDDGRVSKDISQQEKAMKWNVENIGENLINYGLEVNQENIFGAHRFGIDDYSAILFAKDTDKLSDLVENKALFKGFKNVREVKNYVKKQVNN